MATEATDQQMQTFADQRLRVRAEALRALVASLRDDKASIDAEYARATGANPWADARTDGPPKLLASSDFTNYNAVITALLAVIDGTATTADVATIHNNWQLFMSACVRPQ